MKSPEPENQRAGSVRYEALGFSPDGRRLALSSVQSRQILLYELAPPSSDRHPTQEDLEKAVKELTEHDAFNGRKAMATLIAAGEPSVPLLADHLKGEGKPGGREKTIQCLIGDLDNDDFFVREKAMKRLADFGPIATPASSNESLGDVGGFGDKAPAVFDPPPTGVKTCRL